MRALGRVAICLLVATWAEAQTQSGAGGSTLFTDVTDQIGPSLLSSRASAVGDYDNDGWPDLFCTESVYSPTHGTQITLLHNEGNGRFTDQSAVVQGNLPEQVKQARTTFGGGAVFGDYDNDGDLDLFVPVGAFKSVQPARNLLLRNDRGTFVEVSVAAGLTDVLPTDNALWLDYDRDGYLDLFTGNLACGSPLPGAVNRLYRNDGDGTFTDVTEQTGVGEPLALDTECTGGSNGGMLGADVNDDGWTDLYIAVYGGPDRLLLNDQHGHFTNASNEDVANPAHAWGVAVGDVDNDGDLDLVHTSRSSTHEGYFSGLLRNLGGGVFEDITLEAGLGVLAQQDPLGCALGDLDNDGDLDLLTGAPGLFFNNGNGTFSDENWRSGISGVSLGVSLLDYDRDGFLDAWYCSGLQSGASFNAGRLFHNNGKGGHYLRVELAGVRSNRNGIGARLIAEAGDLRQTREITGGMGYVQQELVAHFGLGQRTQVDRLEIHWPSGQVEVLTSIPADQQIRVVEGEGAYHPARGASLVVEPVVAGVTTQLQAKVWPALYGTDAPGTRVTADLTPLGGGAGASLIAGEEGVYRLEAPIAPTNCGMTRLAVTIEEATPSGPRWSALCRNVKVLAATDLVIYGDSLHEGWSLRSEGNSELDPVATTQVAEGRTSLAVRSQLSWAVRWRPSLPVPSGYTAMRFAVRPEDMAGQFPPQSLSLELNGGTKLALISGDGGAAPLVQDRPEWQVVEIPLEALGDPPTITLVRLSGLAKGTVYLDDVRLVAAPTPATAVTEPAITRPVACLLLSPNYPNPFNAGTTIKYHLPQAGVAVLVVYDLLGQPVKHLLWEVALAGEHRLVWDGRDDQGLLTASGVYLCCLTSGGQVQVRRMVLLR